MHSTISFQHIYSYFFKFSTCVLEAGEGESTQIVVLNEIPISLKADSRQPLTCRCAQPKRAACLNRWEIGYECATLKQEGQTEL